MNNKRQPFFSFGKSISLLILALCFLSCSRDQPKKSASENKNLLSTDIVQNPRTAEGMDSAVLASLPVLQFRDSVHDFGTIHEGEVVTHRFSFINAGKTPLIFSNAYGSCGCTVADFPRDPILPGAEGEVTVKFSSSGRTGRQEKNVTLTSNAQGGAHHLFIKGSVQ